PAQRLEYLSDAVIDLGDHRVVGPADLVDLLRTEVLERRAVTEIARLGGVCLSRRFLRELCHTSHRRGHGARRVLLEVLRWRRERVVWREIVGKQEEG